MHACMDAWMDGHVLNVGLLGVQTGRVDVCAGVRAAKITLQVES